MEENKKTKKMLELEKEQAVYQQMLVDANNTQNIKQINQIAADLKNIIKEGNLSNALRDIYVILKKIDETLEGKYNKELEQQKNEAIELFDNALVKNIDVITQEIKQKATYKYAWIEKFPKFKETIEKKGPEFLINFPLEEDSNLEPIEETKKIAEELFGKYDVKIFSIIKFGQYDKIKALVMENIINELIIASEGEYDINDIKQVGKGYFSTVFKVGEYILKYGKVRYTPKIQNNKRIMQPLIRTCIKGETANDDRIVEVQNEGDADWYKNFSDKQIEEILFEIYRDLRDKNTVWLDAKELNVVRLKKPNKPYHSIRNKEGNEEIIRPTSEAIDFEGELSDDEILDTGNYVVCDTDFLKTLEEYRNSDDAGRLNRTYLFERRYKKERAEINNRKLFER